MENGKVLEMSKENARISGTVQSGITLVDGLGVGDVGNIVLRDRKRLSEDGVIIVVVTMSHETHHIIGQPEIISRGFVYVRESEDLMEKIRKVSCDVMDICMEGKIYDWTTIKTTLKTKISECLFAETKRSPMIIPIIMDV